MRSAVRKILDGAALVMAVPLAWAQIDVWALREVAVEVDTGHLGNSGTEEQVVFSRILEAPDAPSVQVLFEAIQLHESSHMRLRSLEDGATQILRRETLEGDIKESVTFRGSRVEIELIAAPGTEHNFVVIRTLLAGDVPGAEEPETEKGKDDPRRWTHSEQGRHGT